MGCGCDTTGYSEKETLLKNCKWMAGWAEGLAKDLDIIKSVLEHIAGGHRLHSNYDNVCDKYELARMLDAEREMCSGLITNIDRGYRDEDGSLLPGLAKMFNDIHEMCSGHKPIPIYGWFSCLDDAAIDFSNKIGGDTTVVSVEGNEDYWRFRQYDDFKEAISKALEDASNEKEIAVLFADKKTARRFFEVADQIETKPGEDCKVNLVEYFKALYPKGIRFFYRHDVIDECDFEKEIAEERKQKEVPCECDAPNASKKSRKGHKKGKAKK